ncbi:hypothetical protein [Candidatus Nucleicultrix amoebiphila]|uniref:YbgF trimerisation domain-containing protein n=1 Tax=Candidatus Nucleicultrix amoebiphila FS5 TaxID=1414854 RepID=A0A1W6N2S5_9PROT|nr:hypothetical protein [Candidatus Nucleicultrix amoebiphila]ARN84147.1 hypothetical protein GQ61_00965 [Candidatus Nucleicultrix amoebiphila FS5]
MKKFAISFFAIVLSSSSLWATDHYYKKYSEIDDPIKSLYEDHYIESKKQTEIFKNIAGELKSMRSELSHVHRENQKLQGILRQQNEMIAKLVSEIKELARRKKLN